MPNSGRISVWARYEARGADLFWTDAILHLRASSNAQICALNLMVGSALFAEYTRYNVRLR